MIIGHVGVAFAARWRWPRIPLGWLVGASLAPDILRGLLGLTGMPWRVTNLYSHTLPWSALLAGAFALLAWAILRDARAAVVVFALVASHIALDFLSGRKELWVTGPTGLNLEEVEQVEFLLECVMAWIGWRLIRGTSAPRWVTSRSLLLLMFVVQAQYLLFSYYSRPWLTRCVIYPFAPCPDR
jgi:hypothetical protein